MGMTNFELPFPMFFLYILSGDVHIDLKVNRLIVSLISYSN